MQNKDLLLACHIILLDFRIDVTKLENHTAIEHIWKLIHTVYIEWMFLFFSIGPRGPELDMLGEIQADLIIRAYMSLFTSDFSLHLERQARVVSVREIVIIHHSSKPVGYMGTWDQNMTTVPKFSCYNVITWVFHLYHMH